MSRYKFGEIAACSKEKRTPTPDDSRLYIGLEHLDTGDLTVHRWGSAVDITGEKLIMHKGDLLFGRRNTYLRRAAIAPHDGLFSAHGMILRPNNKIVDPSFFPFFIASDYFMDAAIRISVGSLSPTVNWSTLKELEFELPAINEQREYARLLWGYERVRQAYQALLSQMDELVKSQFVEMFDDIEGASYQTLEECCKSISGGKTPSMQHPEYYGGNIPYIKSGDVKEKAVSEGALWLTEKALSEGGASLVPAGTVLVVIRSAALRHEFHTAIATVPLAINQDLKALQPKDAFLPEYIMGALIAHEDRLLGGVQTVLTSHIEMKDLLSLPIMVAPIEKQIAFDRFVKQTDKSKLAIRQALESLEKSRSAIMAKVFG